MDRMHFAFACLGAVGSGIVGGIFYGFSSFVMKALGRLPPEQGVAAMRSINLAVVNPSFMLVFMGTTFVCMGLAACSYLWWQLLSGKLILAAALLYLVGCFGMTMVLHQPMNLKLAALPPSQALVYWPQYLATWILWNHARTAAALLAAVLFIAAIVLK